MIRRLMVSGLLAASLLASAPASSQVLMSKEQILFYTSDWKGERFPDGRPKVSDDLVRRALPISLEEAWGTLRNLGYHNQFESHWQTIHEGKPMAGRALTAQYMPHRPDMKTALSARAKELRGWDDKSNIWPIQELQTGDIYVADGYGKVVDGTLIGDVLGTSIYAKSKNGFVFDGSVRDLQGLSAIEGLNGIFREADPSAIKEMQMTRINGPVRIGRATVLPGDIVLAKYGGVVFIPAHLAQIVITQAEFIALREVWGKESIRTGEFGPADIDTAWSPKVKAAFLKWVNDNPTRVPMSKAEFEDVRKRNNF